MENKNPAGVTFTWKIENFLLCIQDTGECLWSPPFESKSLKTKWELLLYPKGHETDDSIDYEIGIFDSQEKVLNYELAFLSPDGLIDVVVRFKNESFSAFRNRQHLVTRDYFASRRREILSNGTLTVRLKIWRGRDEDSCEEEKISARTVIGVRDKAFKWTIPNFDSILANQRATTSVDLNEVDKLFPRLDFELFCDADGEVNIEVIHPQGQPAVALECTVSLLDRDGNTLQKVETEYVFRTGCFALSQYKQVHRFTNYLINRSMLEDVLIPNGVLSLECNCRFSGVVLLEELHYLSEGTIVKTCHSSSISRTETDLVPTTLYQVVVTQIQCPCPEYNIS